MIIAMKKHAYVIGIIFVSALLVRGLVYYGYLQHDANYWQIDSLGYDAVAKGIVAGHGISTVDGAPNFHRVPGYPLYLAAFKKWCGDSPAAALWTQVLLGAFIPVLVFLLALTLFPSQIMLATIAGMYATVQLGLVLYSGFMMTETLFVLFFLLFLVLFFSHCDNPKRLATAGVLLGIASLIRPVGHYLIVLALFILLIQKTYLPIRIRNCALLFLAWLVPVSIWLARNYLLLGHLFFHTLPGGHFLQLSASRVVMHTEHITYQKARERVTVEAEKAVNQQQRIVQRRLSEIERCYLYEKLAIKHFAAHPFITLKLWATDIFRTAFSLYSAELLYLESGRKKIDYFAPDRTIFHMIERYLFPDTDSWWLKIVVWLEILFYSLMLLGFARTSWLLLMCGNSYERMLWLSVVIFMALFLLISLAGGYARMRLPIEPFIIILGLYGYFAEHKRTIAGS